jgi:hypothetical protein
MDMHYACMTTGLTNSKKWKRKDKGKWRIKEKQWVEICGEFW